MTMKKKSKNKKKVSQKVSSGKKVKLLSRMSLQTKLLIPILASVLIGLIVLGFLLFGRIYSNLTLDLIHAQMDSQLDNLTANIELRREVQGLAYETVSNKEVDLAMAVAEAIKENPDMLETDKMQELATSLSVDEIRITDGNGIVAYGNMIDSMGFDLKSTDQTMPFMDLIDHEGSYVQEPSEAGPDSKMFKYIGVSRKDQPGIVQIGLDPTYLMDLDQVLGVQELLESQKIGKSGYFYIIDENGIIKFHKNRQAVGLNTKSVKNLAPLDDESIDFFSYQDNAGIRFVSVHRVDNLRYIATMPISDFVGNIYAILITLAIVIVLELVFLFIVTIVVTRRMFKPLGIMVDNMKKAGEGDLSVQMNVRSHDELGLLASSFNEMVRNVGGLIGKAKNVGEEVSESANNLAASAEQTSLATQEVSKTVDEIARGASEQADDAGVAADLTAQLDSKLVELDQNSKDIASNARNVSKVNEKGILTLNELKEATTANIKSSREITQAVRELEEKSANIDSILQTISSIADQTNLLALNASIEAARAGEHGRGFAVVADEIRKLAEESSKSADQIGDIVKMIQNQTGHAVLIVEEVRNNADIQSESVDNMNVSFGDISKAIDGITGQIENIDVFIQEILQDKDNIVSSIANISAVSEETAAASEEVSATTEQQTAAVDSVASAADQLNELSKELKDQINNFTL